MGAAAALQLAEGGMRVALCEARQLGMGASGVNAGTLSMQTKRVPLIPYALRGYELWKRAGDAVGFKETGSLTLAYTQAEAEGLTQRMTARRNAGAPIDLITAAAARAMGRSSRSGGSGCARRRLRDASLTASTTAAGCARRARRARSAGPRSCRGPDGPHALQSVACRALLLATGRGRSDEPAVSTCPCRSSAREYGVSH